MNLRTFVGIGGTALFIATAAYAGDTDADGIEDSWETSMGLNPEDPLDAFQDLDGDRVPNLWEFYRQSSASDPRDLPEFDAIVDSSQPTNTDLRRYATLQEAYETLPGEGYSVVDVKAGVFTAGVDGGGTAKRVAWLARSGGVILKGPNSGVKLTHETVIDGLVFASAPDSTSAAVEIRPSADLVDTVVEVRLVNCIINGRLSTGAGGAAVNDGGDLWLVHCTVSGNAGAEADGIAHRSGALHLVNSIVWNNRSGKLREFEGEPADRNVEVINSVLRGTEGAWGSDPKLTLDGHLTKASLQCFGRGVAQIGAPTDLHGVSRYEKTPPQVDLGAEQWVDVDNDGLADWWEKQHFGNLNHDGGTSAGKGLTLDQAYRLGMTPANSLLHGTLHDPSVRITFPRNNSVVR